MPGGANPGEEPSDASEPGKNPGKNTPGTSHVDPEELQSSSSKSQSKATSPTLPNELKNLNPPESSRKANNSSQDSLLQVVNVEELGIHVSRLRLEETRKKFNQMSESMKERAVLTMIKCLLSNNPQPRQPLPLRATLSAASSCTSSMKASTIPYRSVTPTQSNSTVHGAVQRGKSNISVSTVSEKLSRLLELEKQVNNMEKQCRIFERHLREHHRDQKTVQMKIHSLEMKILHDGQKQVIWNMIEKIPTQEDINQIESFHSFALERKRTESKIEVLNAKVRALNAAMGQMSAGSRRRTTDNIIVIDAAGRNSRRSDLPDFTLMSVEEREEFFRKCEVPLFEYDKEPSKSDTEFDQEKVTKRKKKSRKINIVEDDEASGSGRGRNSESSDDM